jgi:hypothetical protein
MRFGIIGSLFVSVLALAAAVQANMLAREANELAQGGGVNIEVYEEDESLLQLIYTSVCYLEGAEKPYVAERTAHENFTIVNRGATDAALVTLKLLEGDDEYRPMDLHTVNHLEEESTVILELPMEIPAGSARTFIARVSYSESFPAKNPALEVARVESTEPEYPAKWVLGFSDGMMVTREIDKVAFHTLDNAESAEQRCET